MDAISKIEQIQQDFAERSEPFDDVEFPEKRLLEELPHADMEDRAVLVSMFATFDYNRNASQLVDNIIELFERKPKWFDAYAIPAAEKEMEHVFKDIGFRYGQRDSHGWYANCEILRNNYNGKWTELLLDVGADAERLVQRLNDDGFLYLKGQKIAPMYARIIDDDVAPLTNVWELDIPADTHIIRLTEELSGEQMDANDVRYWWRSISSENDINRAVVDGGLWLIGNNWSDWGEEYWNEVTSEK